MSKESPAMRYFRLSQEIEKKYQEKIKELGEEIMGELNKAIEKELDAMETALNSGDIPNAYYHKLRAEILLSSVLP